jgi:hypothetical protein
VVPQPPVGPHPPHPTQKAAPEHVVRPAREDRCHETRYVLRKIFEVRIQVGHRGGTGLDRGPQARTHRRPESAVSGVPDHDGPSFASEPRRPVGRAVVHDDGVQLVARHLDAGDAIQELSDGGLFVPGRHDDREEPHEAPSIASFNIRPTESFGGSTPSR